MGHLAGKEERNPRPKVGPQHCAPKPALSWMTGRPLCLGAWGNVMEAGKKAPSGTGKDGHSKGREVVKRRTWPQALPGDLGTGMKCNA